MRMPLNLIMDDNVSSTTFNLYKTWESGKTKEKCNFIQIKDQRHSIFNSKFQDFAFEEPPVSCFRAGSRRKLLPLVYGFLAPFREKHKQRDSQSEDTFFQL